MQSPNFTASTLAALGLTPLAHAITRVELKIGARSRKATIVMDLSPEMVAALDSMVDPLPDPVATTETGFYADMQPPAPDPDLPTAVDPAPDTEADTPDMGPEADS